MACYDHLMKRWCVISALLFASIYGTSYQQFRHFSLSQPRGADDAVSYVKMSHWDYNVNPVHRYRFVVPSLVAGIRPVVARAVRDGEEQDKLAFYLINFACTLATALVVVVMLEHLGFSVLSALLGSLIFVSSRITVMVAGTPLVDAPFFFAAVLIVYLALTGRVWWLAATMPLLALLKEPLLAVALLPLLVPACRKAVYGLSLMVSIAGVYAARHLIDRAFGSSSSTAAPASLVEVMLSHLGAARHLILRLFTPTGLHDVQNGFSLFLLLALLGFAANRRKAFMPDRPILLALIPLSLFFAVISGNFGRMLFLAFPVVIPYALIYIQGTLGIAARSR